MHTPFPDKHPNLLPYDGTAIYFGRIMSPDEAGKIFGSLLQSTGWQNDEVLIYGKRYITKRKTAWYGDGPFMYTYSNVTRTAVPWTSELESLKKVIEKISGHRFNSCLLNLYHSGSEGMSWHSDNEKMLIPNAPIASVSLGAERTFRFRHKTTKAIVNISLEPGSLLLMQDVTQTYWQHALPKSSRIKEPRINLTFRYFKL